MFQLHLIHSKPQPTPAPRQDWRFTSRDLLALSDWMQRAGTHGYRRHVIESGSGSGTPEDGGYVLLYAQDRAWANWGLARNGDQITVWHCGSGVDLGRFPSMHQALESLPSVWSPATRKVAMNVPAAVRSNVVCLATARRVQPGAIP